MIASKHVYPDKTRFVLTISSCRIGRLNLESTLDGYNGQLVLLALSEREI